MGNDARQFRLLRVLGAGGFGRVYEALMTDVGGVVQNVALKVVAPDGPHADEALRRLRDEARMLGLLRHRAVVRVVGLARLEIGHAAIMEYIDGVDGGMLVKQGAIPVAHALFIAEEVASALAAAWSVRTPEASQLHLIHRDIKPANIRITEDGQVKVLDFGAARADFAARESRTAQYVIGSARYMAPERLLGRDTPAVDVYSLGLVLAQLITRITPSEQAFTPRKQASMVEEMVAAVEERIRAEDFPDPDGAMPALLRTMLSFEADNRPSASEVERACRALRERSGAGTFRDWASRAVPSVPVSKLEARGDEWVGKTLVELRSGEGAGSPSGQPARAAASGEASVRPDAPSGARASSRVLGAVVLGGGLTGLGLLGLLVLAAVAYLALRDDSDERGEASATAPVPLAQAAPVAAAPAAAATAPAPASAATAPTTALRVSGDATTVVARSAEGEWPLPGSPPPGQYTVTAEFADGKRWSGEMDLSGMSMVVCQSAVPRCRAR